MANWIPGGFRKVTTCGCLLLISGEAFDLHATHFAWKSAPYVLPSTAANYENLHVEREDYGPNGWDAQGVSASDSSSGAMSAGNNGLVESFHRSLETSGCFLFVDADSAAGTI